MGISSLSYHLYLRDVTTMLSSPPLKAALCPSILGAETGKHWVHHQPFSTLSIVIPWQTLLASNWRNWRSYWRGLFLFFEWNYFGALPQIIEEKNANFCLSNANICWPYLKSGQVISSFVKSSVLCPEPYVWDSLCGVISSIGCFRDWRMLCVP